MKIYDSLMDIINDFEVFLFDAYGVFWNGDGFYKNSKETMRLLVNMGKTVVVVSNATLLHEDMVASYRRKGMMEGIDYNFMVSSGEVLREDLLNQKLSFNTCTLPHCFYTIGASHEKMFTETMYRQVDHIENADFIFCGVPFLTKEDVIRFSEYSDCFLPVKINDKNEVFIWDTTIIEPFLPIIEKAAALKLPVLNANPDYLAQEGHPLLKSTEAQFVIRNGTIAETLRQQGNELLEYGKPHKNIYDYVFAELKNCGKMVAKNKICMIGDTIRTDIKGAVNSGIVPVLCVQTGVTAMELSKGNTVKNLCESENIDVQQIIEINSVGGK